MGSPKRREPMASLSNFQTHQRMATDEFNSETVVASLFGHQAEARQGGVESLVDTLVTKRGNGCYSVLARISHTAADFRRW
jgi:hypothetical protein